MTAAQMAERNAQLIEQDRLIAEAVGRDEPRLRSFIRRRVADLGDAEDVLQDVFYELTEAYRSLRPAEEMTAWLFRVARNRITDLFRRRKAVSLNEPVEDEGGGGAGATTWEDLLPSPEAGPDAVYARQVLLEELDDAIAELPENQREVFVAHELLGRSFAEIAGETGVGVNTLLSRKRYAVLHLRRRLREMWESFGITEEK
jgi:RNA polymerase sigma factor (sigma-70 family)